MSLQSFPKVLNFRGVRSCIRLYMRKLLVAGFIFICSCYSAQAQISTPDHRFAVGIKAGPTLSFITRTNDQYSFETADVNNFAQGYTGGLSIQYFTESNFALQIEGFYTQKGWQEVFYDSTSTLQRQRDDVFRTTLNYLEVPITAHGYIGKKNVRIFLDGGFYLSYLLSYNIIQDPDVADYEVSYRISDSNANRIDLGIKGGAGFEVATKAGTFQLGGSYAWGIGSVIKKYQTTPKNAAEGIPNMLQNNTITITLGYYVEFGKSGKADKEK